MVKIYLLLLFCVEQMPYKYGNSHKCYFSQVPLNITKRKMDFLFFSNCICYNLRHFPGKRGLQSDQAS